MAITTHQIGLHSLSGAIFWCILSAVIFYVLGFATVGWEYGNFGRGQAYWVGLWHVCQPSASIYATQDWFTAVQAMITIGLILLLAGAIAIILYMFFHSMNINKNALIITFTVLVFAAVIFMLIGFIIFGAKHQLNLNWSYAFSVIGACFCFAAGIISLVHMKNSNVI